MTSRPARQPCATAPGISNRSRARLSNPGIRDPVAPVVSGTAPRSGDEGAHVGGERPASRARGIFDADVVKERLDHSCAVFDARGRLVAQAAHIPVHLGSMPLAVEAAIAACRRHEGRRAERLRKSFAVEAERCPRRAR